MSRCSSEGAGLQRLAWRGVLAVLAVGLGSCGPDWDFGSSLPPPSSGGDGGCMGCGGPLPTPPGPPLPPIVTSAKAPPPISGGTLLVTRDGTTAVAADPERDQLWVVDVARRELVTTLALEPGDEPGRLAEDDAGRVHVALRRGGAVVTLERTQGWHVSERRAACAAPRGIAWDASAAALRVACQEGVLVTLPAVGTEGVRQQSVAPDLRDVVVQDGRVWVSRFKSAQVLGLGPDGQVQVTLQPPAHTTVPDSVPSVAWRMVGGPLGLTMVHQQAQVDPVSEVQGGYGGGGRPPIVQSAWTRFPANTGSPSSVVLPPGIVLPVDVAVSPSGRASAVAVAGSDAVMLGAHGTAVITTPEQLSIGGPGQEPVAVAFASDTVLLVLTRAPSLQVVERSFDGTSLTRVALPGESRNHTGHTVFHRNAGGGLACASCHPEGGEDGRTWTFVQAGARRTQPLWGGILDTAPFHWSGDLTDMSALMGEVFVRRMGGGVPTPAHVTVLAQWMDTLKVPPRPPVADLEAVERGRALFHSAEVGCASCHAGAKGTSVASQSVGTGAAFQVPHLMGLAYRAPYLHSGCAPTLRERFAPCGGGDAHGRTSQLTSTQLDDLLLYLETL